MGEKTRLPMANQGYEAGEAVRVGGGAPDAPPEYTMVFGLSFEDPEVAALVRKVLRISMVGALFVVVNKVVRWETLKNTDDGHEHNTNIYDLIISIMIGLLVPACGYFGAKKKDKNLLGCFYGWSLGCGICGGLSAMFMCMYMVTGIPTRNADGSPSERVEEVPVLIGVVNIVFGTLQAIIYGIQYTWGKELALQQLFAQIPEPDIEMQVQTAHAHRAAPVQPMHVAPVMTAVPVGVHMDAQMAANATLAGGTKPPEYEASPMQAYTKSEPVQPARSNME